MGIRRGRERLKPSQRMAALAVAAIASVAVAASAGSVGAARHSTPSYLPVFLQGAAGQFASGNWQDYVFNTASGKRTKIFPPNCDASGFSRSGDRALVLCTAASVINGVASGPNGLYLFHPSKRKPLRLAPNITGQGMLGAALSLDAKTAVYARLAGSGVASHLFRISTTGGKAKQLTFGSAADADATFTPNGRWILFDRTAAGSNTTAVYAIPVGGGAPHRVGVFSSSLLVGGVSPDGSTLLWRSDYELHAQSFNDATATVTSSGPDQVLLHDVSGGGGLWSPDGSQIGFGRQLNLNGLTEPHAAIANSDGTGERTISPDPTQHKSIVLAWLPASAASRWGK